MDNEFEFEQTPETDPVPEIPEVPAEPETPDVPVEPVEDIPAAAVPLDPLTPPVTPPETPEPRKRGKLWIGIAAVVVVLALAIGLGAQALAGGSTAQRSAKGLAANPTVAFFKELAKTGMTYRAEIGLEPLIGYDGAVTVETKTEMLDPQKARAVFDMGLVLGGNELADLFYYADPERLVLGSDALLPEQSLGVDLAHLRENLDHSLLAPDSGSDYALDRETFDMLQEYLGSMNAESQQTLAAQLEQVFRSAGKMLGKSVKAHTSRDKENGILLLGEEQVKVKVHSYEADEEDVYAILLDSLHWAQDSQELRGLLEQWLRDYPALLADYSGTEEALNSFYTQLNDYIQELETGRQDFLTTNEDLELELEYYTSRSKGELLGLKLHMETYHAETTMELTWGPSLEKLHYVNFKLEDGSNRYTGSYTVRTDDKERFDAVLKLRENSHTVFEGSFLWYKADGAFTLELGDVSLKGQLEKRTDGIELRLQQVVAYNESMDIDVKLSLLRGADIGPAPDYRELTAMSETDFDQLVTDLQMAAYALLQNGDLSSLISGLLY